MLAFIKGRWAFISSSPYFSNSSWMMGEQFVRILANVFVAIYIARYLGPKDFGVLSYFLALTAFEVAISRLGMESIVVREASKHGGVPSQVVGTAFGLMMGSALILSIVFVLSLIVFDDAKELHGLGFILFVSPIFTALYVVDFYFQSQLKSKYSAVCKTLAISIMSIIKLLLVYLGFSLFWIGVAFLLDVVVLSLLFFYALYKQKKLYYLISFSTENAKVMLQSAWPMVLTSIAVLIYMKIDQIMIKHILGMESVGLYTAAIKVYEAWIILPSILSVSLLPLMVSLKSDAKDKYVSKMIQIFSGMIWLSIIAIIAVKVISYWLIPFAFGMAYIEAIPVLNVVMFSAVFAAMGSVSGRYFTVERMEKKIAFRTILSACLNVALNYLLIPLYGIMGAAYSTLFCLFFANYLLDYFDPDLKPLRRMKNQALLYPYKLIKRVYSR